MAAAPTLGRKSLEIIGSRQLRAIHTISGRHQSNPGSRLYRREHLAAARIEVVV